MVVGSGVTGSVGDTPLVELKRVVPSGHARVFAKVESHNPTGSTRDRMAREEALFAWTLSGANVVASLQIAERLGPGRFS